MAYSSTTIKKILDRINSDVFLPSLQRPYVWKKKDIELLFDSLMLEYPISSFLIWHINPSNVDGLDVYKFIEDYSSEYNINPIANLGSMDVELVLDGQQRLTSLLIGLKGSYKEKTRGRLRTKFLYLNTLHYADSELGVSQDGAFEFKFMEPSEVVNSRDSYWYKVSDIMNHNNDLEFKKSTKQLCTQLSQQFTYQEDQINIFKFNLELLYKVICNVDNISYYTERDNSHERVLNIFLRANSAGEKLTRSALMMSTIVTGWGDSKAREDIVHFLKSNEGKGCPNGRNSKWLDTDWLMKACLAICDLPVVYKIENFNKNNLGLIKSNWELIKKAISEVVKLVNGFGIDGHNLTAKNALMPIVYYIAHTNFSAANTDSETAENSERIRRWIFKVLISRGFGAASDGKVISARKIIANSLSVGDFKFPEKELQGVFRLHQRLDVNDSSAVDSILDAEYKDNRYCYLILTLLYPKLNHTSERYSVDHIMPASMFNEKNMISAGLRPEDLSFFKSRSDKVANLCLLSQEENNRKSNRSIGDWICNQGVDYCNYHMIPTIAGNIDMENFLDFYNKRYEIIKEKLESILWGSDSSEVPTVNKWSASHIDLWDRFGEACDELRDIWFGWSTVTQENFSCLISQIEDDWSVSEIYIPEIKAQEDLVVSIKGNDIHRVDAKLLGIKLFNDGFIIKLSKRLTTALEENHDYMVNELSAKTNQTTECVNITVDAEFKRSQGRLEDLVKVMSPYVSR